MAKTKEEERWLKEGAQRHRTNVNTAKQKAPAKSGSNANLMKGFYTPAEKPKRAIEKNEALNAVKRAAKMKNTGYTIKQLTDKLTPEMRSGITNSVKERRKKQEEIAKEKLSSAKDRRSRAAYRQELRDALYPLTAQERRMSWTSRDQLQDMKELWTKGKRLEEQKRAAHDAAEWIRLQYGFSGGEGGMDYILPELTAEEQNLTTKRGRRMLRGYKLLYDRAKAAGDQDMMEKASSYANDLRVSPVFWDHDKVRAYRDRKPDYQYYDAHGRPRYTPSEYDAETQANFFPAIKNSIEGSLRSFQEAGTQALRNNIDNRNNNAYQSHKRNIETAKQMIAQAKTPEERDKWKKILEESQKMAKETKIDTPVSEYSYGHWLKNFADEQAQRVVDGMDTKAGKMVAQAALSLGQMAPALATGLVNPALPMVVMGVQAAGSKAADLNERGVGASEAFGRGVVSGLIEGVTEKIPVGNLMKILDGTGGTKVIKNLFKQAGLEASEEALSYALNYFADKAAKDPEAEFSLMDMANSAIVGALSGGVMGGGTSLFSLGGRPVPAETNPEVEKPVTLPTAEEAAAAGMRTVPTAEEQAKKLLNAKRTRRRLEGDALKQAATEHGVAQETLQSVERMSGLLGRKISFYETENARENGYFDRKSGEICLNISSKNPLAQIIGHELTHSIESAGSYGKLEQIVKDRIKQTGQDLDAMKADKKDLYAKHGETLDDTGAMQEVVAEYIEKNLLTDEASILNVVNRDRSLGQRILQWLDVVLSRMGNTNAQERAFLSRARDLYHKALLETTHVEEGHTTENQTAGMHVLPTAEQAGRELVLPTAAEMDRVPTAEEQAAMIVKQRAEVPPERVEVKPGKDVPLREDTVEATQESQTVGSMEDDEYLADLRDALSRGEITEEEFDALFDEYYQGGSEYQYSLSREEDKRDNVSYRYYGNPDNAMSDFGHAMFVDDIDASAEYGDHLFTVNHDDLEDIRSYIDEIEEKLREDYESGTLPVDIESIIDSGVSFRELAEEFDPGDIVNSASAWDNGDMLEWFWNRIADEHDIAGVKTSDGAVVFDENLISYRGNYRSGEIDREDIRYSLSETEEYESLMNSEPEDLSSVQEEIARGNRVDKRTNLNHKAKKYLGQTEKTMMVLAADSLGVSKFLNNGFLRGVVEEVSREYLNAGRVTQETVDRLFETAYRDGVMVDDEYYNNYKHIKDYLRTTAVRISETDSHDIADFNSFRKSAFGTLRISKDGTPVDAVYQELQEMAPELFHELNHPADMLVRMFEVGKDIQKVEKSLDDYYGPDAQEYKQWAKRDFEESVYGMMGELKKVKRYADERAKELESPKLSTIEEVMETYKALKDTRKAVEKATAKNLLTDHDNVMVGRLLRGETELELLNPEKENVKGITAVYEAKVEYEKQAKLIREWNLYRKAKLRELADGYLEDANNWKDKKSGIMYSRETMERNVYDIIKAQDLAEMIIDEYFIPVHESQAQCTRLKNLFRQRVRDMHLSTRETKAMKKAGKVSEAHAVQLLGEAMDNIEMLKKNKRMKVRDGKTLEDWQGVVQDMWAKNPRLDQGKIGKAVEEFRQIYDELFQMMNASRVMNGYEPVNYRKGYFPHFQEGEDGGILSLFGKALGIQTGVTDLPTTINGLTHAFKPGIQYFSHSEERKGWDTQYDAVEGFDKYVEGVADVIYQTENIQKLRALASQIRYRTGDEGIRKQVDAVRARTDRTEQEKEAAIREIYENGRFSMSGFVVELEEYTNLLANKKSRRDRDFEKDAGRLFYNVMIGVENRIAGNMVAVNPGSWLTNFIALTQGGSQLSTGCLLRGMWQTLHSNVRDDGMVDASTFLTNRKGSDPVKQTLLERASAKASSPMIMIDEFVSGSLVRARYNQNVAKGMSETEAMRDADAWTAGVMADRSKGAMPTLFYRKNPMTKLFTQFQLEVNNQMSYLFKDIPREQGKKGAAAVGLSLFKFFLGAMIYNEVYEYFIGRRPALDPFGILIDAGGDWMGYDVPNLVEFGVSKVTGQEMDWKKDPEDKYETVAGALGDVAESLPFIGGVLGGGRLPIKSAFPDFQKIGKSFLDDDWNSKKRLATLGKEMKNPASYILMPFGGGQLKKFVESGIALKKGGSYTVDVEGNELLQYPFLTDDPFETAWNVGQAMIFGKTSIKTGQEWINNGFQNLSNAQTKAYQTMEEAGVPGKVAWALIQEMKKAGNDNQLKREILADSLIDQNVKKVIYPLLFGDKQEDGSYKISDNKQKAMDSFFAVGMNMNDFLKVDMKYSELYKTDARAGEKATELALWADKQGYTAEHANTIKNGFKFYSHTPAEAGNYDKMIGEGIDGDISYQLSKKIGALEPEDGKKQVSNLQKWRVVVDEGLTEEQEMAALKAFSDEVQYQKFVIGKEFGVDPAYYVKVKDTLNNYDADKNGDYNHDEINAAMRDQGLQNLPDGSTPTARQKAAVWQLLTGSTTGKNNPYGSSVGNEVVKAVAKAKEDAKKEKEEG